MKSIIVAVLMLAPAPVLAQEPGVPTIVVQGVGTAESPPDSFFIGGALQGRGDDQVSALRALAEVQGRVTDGIQRLDGLTGARVRTDAVEVEPLYAQGCRADRYDAATAGSPINGYAARMRFQFKGAPASAAGNAVSLAAELGALNVSTTGTDLEDDDALRTEAHRLAFADAQAQAEALAAASGRRLGRILRIQNADARTGDYQPGAVEEIVVTGSRVRPTVALPVDQPPVSATVRLNVVFELQ